MGTPPEVIERLNREIKAGLVDPAIKAQFAAVGATPMIATRAEFGAFLSAETERWAKVIQAANIKPE